MRFFIVTMVCSILSACLMGGEPETGAVVEYNGVGFHTAKQQTTLINGEIVANHHSGGEILLEARHSVPCKYGRCPVIGNPPVGSQVLQAPGPFSLLLTQAANDLVLVATYRSPSGATRVAHVALTSDASVLSNIQLSLDRPYPPLRP